MPIYEYRCADCDSIFERLTVGENGKKKVECTACGSAKVSQIFSTFAALTTSGAGKEVAEGPPRGCPRCNWEGCG